MQGLLCVIHLPLEDQRQFTLRAHKGERTIPALKGKVGGQAAHEIQFHREGDLIVQCGVAATSESKTMDSCGVTLLAFWFQTMVRGCFISNLQNHEGEGQVD